MAPDTRSAQITSDTKTLILFALLACAGVVGMVALFYLLPDAPADPRGRILYLLVKGTVSVASTLAVLLGPLGVLVQLVQIAADARATRRDTGGRG